MHTGLSNVEIGPLFNLSLSAVTKASDRIKKKIKEDSVFAKEIETLINSIFKV